MITMVAKRSLRITVRDAEDADVPELTFIKGGGTEALHRDRLRDAQGSGFRYLVLVVDHVVMGFACLVMHRPASWSDAADTQHLPRIDDLRVKESHRGQGYGSAFVRAIERIATAAGYRQLYLSVEPVHNPRAYVLYQRLGFRPLQMEPYLSSWEFTDSAGVIHHGEDWVVDMVKELSADAQV
jgi:GNAT superfamily N-acetyltransferase